jgi:hypothetical protein
LIQLIERLLSQESHNQPRHRVPLSTEIQRRGSCTN